jgi:integrase
LSLDAATATEIAGWAAERVTDSHSSRGQAAAALKHYWRLADHPRPPLRAVPVPPAPEMVCRAIPDDRIEWLVKVATGWWPEGTAVLAGMTLALRRFEIAKMEWSRFDTDLAWYRVTGKYSKTATLPVHRHLIAELEYRRDGSPWVFPGRYEGRHVNPATVGAWCAMVGREAGIDHLTPHELRHTTLAVANDNTQDLRSVQTFARHSKPSTTAGYTRTTATRLREVSDALDYLD